VLDLVSRKDLKSLLCLTACSGALAGLMALSQSSCLAWIIDRAHLRGAGLEEVSPGLALLFTIFALRGRISWLRERAALNFAFHLEEGLRRDIAERVIRLGPLKAWEKKAGDKVAILLEKVEAVGEYFRNYFPLLITASSLSGVILISSLLLYPVVFLVFSLSTGAGVFLLSLIGRWADGRAQERWNLLGRMNDYLLDLLEGMATLKMFGRSREHGIKIWRVGEDFRIATMEVLKVAFLSSLVLELITTLGIAMIAVILSLRLLAGNLDFFFAFFFILLAPEYYLYIKVLSSRYHVRLAGRAAAQEVRGFLGLPPQTGISRPHPS